MDKNILSIIIPVFNGAGYVKDSLFSILNIVPDGVEIIVVDDGSRDGTSEIIKSSFVDYIESGKLKLFCRENSGVSAARNFGIDQSTGTYIGFMDADDVVLPNYFEIIFKGIDSGADIIDFGFRKFTTSIQDEYSFDCSYTNPCFGFKSTPEVIDKVFSVSRWYPWTRVFRSILFDGIRFPVGVRFCEDLMTIPYLYEKSSSVISFEEAVYGYRINASGATLNVRPDYIENLTKFFRSIPLSGLKRHDYLRIATAYSIFSCNEKSTGTGLSTVPKDIYRDIKSLRYSLAVYRNIDYRIILILLYPNAFYGLRWLKKIFRGFK